MTKASIPETEVRTLKSTRVDQDYRISVALPYSYATNPETRYSTIYLLDSNWYFGLVTEQSRIMQRCESFPETIIVGIGYPHDEPLQKAWKQVNALRTRDLTPEVDLESAMRIEAEDAGAPVTTGGADRFLAFIEKELVPLIDAEYRSKPDDRTLAGHSFGGLFVLYALFHGTHLFTRYLAASPSLGYANEVTFSYESTYAKRQEALPVSVYLSVGEEEQSPEQPRVEKFYRFVGQMQSRNYDGLSLTKHVFPDCDHCDAVAPAFQAGFRALLGPPRGAVP